MELVASCNDLKMIKHREIVAYCGPVNLIAQIVTDEKVDLVIAGSHGASGMERLALGSIAESILQCIPCPTLVVGPHCMAVEHPFRSILLATDLGTDGPTGCPVRIRARGALLWKANAAACGRAEDDARRAPIRIFRGRHTSGSAASIARILAIYTSGEVRIEHGKAGETITHVAHSICPSLIVMGVREGAMLSDHALGSTLAHVIREAHCPVLVVRRTLQ